MTDSALLVTLTVAQLRELVQTELAQALRALPTSGASEVLDLEGVAALLGRHPKTIKKLIDEQGLPASYISPREPRFMRSDVLAWIKTLPTKSAEKAA